MKTLKFLLCALMIMSGMVCHAQGPFTKALSKMRVEELPYPPQVRISTPDHRCASVPDDFQGGYYPVYQDRYLDSMRPFPKEYPGIYADRLFRLPDGDYYLVSVVYDEFPERCTDVLFLTDSSAEALDRLEAFIGPEHMLATKEYRIDENGIITTYQIIPLERKEEFSRDDFRGYRQDTVYKVQDGKFVKVKTIDYAEQIMCFREITDEDFSIWNLDSTVTKVTEY